MKTLLTFAALCLFTFSSMAADRYPSVTIKSRRNFEIVVDGQRYYGDNSFRLDRLQRGFHTIKVYERRRGLFGIRTYVVASRRFIVRNDDIRITVDYNGNLEIDEIENRWDKNRRWKDDNHDWDDHDRNDYGHDDRGNNKNKGRGNGNSRRY